MHRAPAFLRRFISGALVPAALLTALFTAACAAPAGPPILGQEAKIRLGWTQWQHWNDNTAPKAGPPLLDALANVGCNVYADWSPNEAMGRHARKLGIRYYAVSATANMRGHAQEQKSRMAVDRYGMTCEEQFIKFEAEGGDIHAGWNKYGEHHFAYVPCPLEAPPWKTFIFDRALKGAAEGWLDGFALDAEPYGAYSFDQYGDMLCYCDHCFDLYRRKNNIADEVAPADRFNWLEERKAVTAYLTLIREHQIAMFRELAQPIRDMAPQFAFALYPDFKVHEVRADWRLQGIAFGLHKPDAPFLVVDATPYWEDHRRPFWEQRHDAYRQAGFLHVLGSWDAMMAGYPYMDVGAEQANYEFAMASDGYWRWGERVFNPNDWRMFATVNRRLRQVESKVGDYLLRGRVVYNFVTLIEQTGNPWLERAIVANTYQQGDGYLVKLNNGNKDWPVDVRVRFALLGAPGPGERAWKITDPIHDMVWVQADGKATWSDDDLHRGVTVALRGRDELFLLIEPAADDFKPDPRTTIPSFEVDVHLPRPETPAPPDDANDAAGENPLSGDTVLFTRTYNHGSYTGATSGGGLVTKLAIINLATKEARDLFAFPGYVQEPAVAPDARHVAAATWNNGRSQIYLINPATGHPMNISNNAYRDRTPVFSPDGGRLAFVSDRDGDWNIYTMAVDGSDVRRLTDAHGADKSPAFSPDGSRIAFISNRRGEYDVFTMNADGSDQKLLLPRDGNEYEPTWSPDGRHLACTVQRRWNRCIQISLPDGRDPHYVALGNVTNLWSISWSPDGQRLAGAYSHLANAGVVTVDRNEKVVIGQEDWNGERLTKLIDVPPIVAHPNEWYHAGGGTPRQIARLFSGVSYSPDGSKLIYCANATESGSFNLFSIDTELPEPVEGEPPAKPQPTPLPGTGTAWPAVTVWPR